MQLHRSVCLHSSHSKSLHQLYSKDLMSSQHHSQSCSVLAMRFLSVQRKALQFWTHRACNTLCSTRSKETQFWCRLKAAKHVMWNVLENKNGKGSFHKTILSIAPLAAKWVFWTNISQRTLYISDFRSLKTGSLFSTKSFLISNRSDNSFHDRYWHQMIVKNTIWASWKS